VLRVGVVKAGEVRDSPVRRGEGVTAVEAVLVRLAVTLSLTTPDSCKYGRWRELITSEDVASVRGLGQTAHPEGSDRVQQGVVN
jgi:hypothetical protein